MRNSEIVDALLRYIRDDRSDAEIAQKHEVVTFRDGGTMVTARKEHILEALAVLDRERAAERRMNRFLSGDAA